MNEASEPPRSPAEAFAHERLAVVALHRLGARLLVTRGHLLLLRHVLLALEARAHERLALVRVLELLPFGVGVALLHLLLLLGEFFLVLGMRRRQGQDDGEQRCDQLVHAFPPCGWNGPGTGLWPPCG